MNENHFQLIFDVEVFKLSKANINLISFFEQQMQKDSGIEEIYNDIFFNYVAYCRENLHKQLLSQL